MGTLTAGKPADAALVYSLTVTDPGDTPSGFTGHGQIELPDSQGSGTGGVDFSFEVTSFRSVAVDNNKPTVTSKTFGNNELDSGLTWLTNSDNSAFDQLNLAASFLNDAEFSSIAFAIPPSNVGAEFCPTANSSGYFCLASADGTGVYLGQFSAHLVPLPAALPLFASAVFGIGVLSLRRRRTLHV